MINICSGISSTPLKLINQIGIILKKMILYDLMTYMIEFSLCNSNYGGAGFIGTNEYPISHKESYCFKCRLSTYAGSLTNLVSIEKHPKYSFEQTDIRIRIRYIISLKIFNLNIFFIQPKVM